ncbi:hypothetical protein [Mesobacillus subterraneus]|uniref:hypothetical protein n=1 Tax=Mesobacillus subterraneus TaxID=285983 RepID=UPI00069C1D51|nr:hypothetical protein [Mesobacillus subterraneus]
MFNTLKTEKGYRKLFLAGVINGIGDRFSQVALLTLILQMTGSGLAVGITMALRMIPFFAVQSNQQQPLKKNGPKKRDGHNRYRKSIYCFIFSGNQQCR